MKRFYDALLGTLGIKPSINVSNGSTTCEDPPGNKLCALHRPPMV